MRVQTDGLAPALEALHQVHWTFRRGILQKALNVGMRPIIAAAKKNAKKIPKDSGNLAAAVQSRSSKGKMNMKRAWVGIGAENTPNTWDLKTGWKGKKFLKPNNPAKYAHLKEGGGHFGNKNQPKHYVRPYPLFADALRGRQSKFYEDFNKEVEKGLKKAFEKAQAKTKGGAIKALKKSGL